MKNRQMLLNMISSFFAFIVNIGITFFLTPYIVAKTGIEAYSFISISSTFISFASIITIALNSMASRFISIEINANRIEKATEYYSSIFISNLILSIAFTIPSIICIVFLDNILNIPNGMLRDVQTTFIFVFINFVVAVIGNVFAVGTFAKNRLELSSVSLILGNLIRALITIILFLAFPAKIYFVTATNLIVAIFTVVTNIIFTKKLIPEMKLSINKFSRLAVKTLLSSGIWNSINQLSNVLLNQLDLLIANIFINSIAGGQYSIVKIIPSFMLSFISMVTSVFIPRLMILYAQKNKNELVNNINSSMKIISFFITIPIGFLLVFGDVFFGLWVPGEDTKMLYLLSQLTLIPLIITGCGNMIFNIYTITNKLKIPALFMVGSGVLKTLLIVIVLRITNLGILAIPLISAGINIVNYITFMPLYAAKCLNIKKNTFYSAIFKSVLCTIMMVIVCIIIKNIFYITTWIQLFITAGISALVAGIINYFIVFSSKERKAMLNLILKN